MLLLLIVLTAISSFDLTYLLVVNSLHVTYLLIVSSAHVTYLLIVSSSHVTYLFLHVPVLRLDSLVQLSNDALLLRAGTLAYPQLLLQLTHLPLQIAIDVNLGLTQTDLAAQMLHLDV